MKRRVSRIANAALPLACALALSLPGCGGAPKQKAEAAGGEPAKRTAIREVKVTTAESGSLRQTVAVSGTLAADQQVELGFKVAGRIEQMPVDLGSPVRQGQPIARLTQRDFELRVAQARNALEQARALLGLPPGVADVVDVAETSGVRQTAALLKQAKLTHDRAQSLFRQQLIAQSELDAADAAYSVAEAKHQDAIQEARNRQAVLAQRQAELALAEQQLTDSTLVAPWDGVVRERRAGAGDYLAIGQAAVVLVRIHPLRLRLAVPEREAPTVHTGQTVELRVEGDPELFTGRLARISPSISEDNRTLIVEAEVPNPKARLRPGAFARAEIVVSGEKAKPAILVPASSVVSFAGVEKVIGVKDGRATEAPVRTGRRDGERVEILSGLAPGDPVVVQPGNLVGGDRVKAYR